MSDHDAQGNAPGVGTVQATPGNADKLRAEADELYAQAFALQVEAARAMARSEIISAVTSARLDVEHAETELAEAREREAAAQLAYDPVRADLDRVRGELAQTEVTGDLDARVAARVRRLALEEELAPLEEMEQRQLSILTNAQGLVVALERDTLPYFREALAEAEAAFSNPPLDDVAKLMGADRGEPLAPLAGRVHAMRLGIELLAMEPGRVREPHGLQIILAIVGSLKMSGAFDLIREDLERYTIDLLVRRDPRAANSLRAAFWERDNADLIKARTTPGYKGITGEDAPEPAGLVKVDPVTGQEPGPTLDRFPTIAANAGAGGAQGAQLPPYDSAEGARLRRADQGDGHPQGPFVGFPQSSQPGYRR